MYFPAIKAAIQELCIIHRGELEELIYEHADRLGMLEDYAGEIVLEELDELIYDNGEV